MVGKRAGHEAVVLTLLEKKTENYLAIRIPGKTSKAVMDAMAALWAEYGERFPQVFKTITVGNGSGFAGFAQTEVWGSIEPFTDEDILASADGMNGRPRRKLGYCTPEELFEAFLDTVYTA